MKGFTLAAAATALFASANAAIDPIVIKGPAFFYKTNGTQFFMKGVAYQQGVNTNTTQSESADYTDPLADEKSCTRDIPFLQQLQTNTIRVYALDPTKNHDACMTALANAGIYVVADLSQPGESIVRDSPEWTTALYSRYTSVVDVMAKYDNTLGFFAGNEVSNAPNNTFASAFVKAAVRDMKAYIKSKNYRPIGVGYATNDDASIRSNLASYFDCGNRDEAIDFWGYNIYSWCGDSSFQKSGYDVRTKEFQNFDVPVFFAEYGCNTPRPRKFTEVGTLYGSQMTGTWSGGIVYMYFEEANEFGLVTIGSDGKPQPNDDFKNLKAQIAKVSPKGTTASSANTGNKAASCPAQASDWAAVSSPLPPIANAQLCGCMMDTVSCVPDQGTDEKEYGDIFGTLCGYEDGKYCAGINKNITTGGYGTYSMCNSTEQLAFALNQYVKAVPNGCDFKGKATKKQAASSTPSSCKALIDQAGTQGTGVVTSAPQATGANGASKSTGAAAGLSIPQIETGLLKLGVYVGAAVLSGMALILL